MDQALSSGQKPAAKRPAAAAAATALPNGDLSFGRLDISKCVGSVAGSVQHVLHGVSMQGCHAVCVCRTASSLCSSA